MSHTPGPWTLEYWGDREVDVYAGEDTLVCSLRGGSTHPDDDSDADASLIAAAPDLLFACRCAWADLEGMCELVEEDHPCFETIEELKAVIAKAEGGA